MQKLTLIILLFSRKLRYPLGTGGGVAPCGLQFWGLGLTGHICQKWTGFIVAPMLALAATPAAAADTTGTGTAAIYEPIQFAVLLDMDFGKIVSDTTGGTVHIDPVNITRSCPVTMTCLGTFSFSELQLTGSDATVVVSYSPSFQLTGPGAPITVEPEFPGGSGTAIQLTGGSAIFQFGAQVHINPNQTAGSYTGNFSVDVSYQ
jgi:hypothetical protein